METKESTLTTYCLDCGETLTGDFKFCPNCGQKQKKAKCVHCSKEINAHWNFCPFCKKSLKVKSFIGNNQVTNDWLRQILAHN